MPTIHDDAADRWWARRKSVFAHPTKLFVVALGRDDVLRNAELET